MSGRMGTRADVVFGPSAIVSLMNAIERSGENGGLAGSKESDDKGDFFVVTGAGRPDIGLYFVSEGIEVADAMVDELHRCMSEGVIVVTDPEIGELAVYKVGSDGAEKASALMSERYQTHMA